MGANELVRARESRAIRAVVQASTAARRHRALPRGAAASRPEFGEIAAIMRISQLSGTLWLRLESPVGRPAWLSSGDEQFVLVAAAFGTYGKTVTVRHAPFPT
jgi:hypothetical protein